MLARVRRGQRETRRRLLHFAAVAAVAVVEIVAAVVAVELAAS